MTALNEFERLESTGIWRETPEAQRRDVIVAIGDATLVISDNTDTALSHWSLPAIERLNPGERPAIFRPGPDAVETLELEDDSVIRGIATVHTAIERRRPHPGRLRYYLTAGFVLIVAAVSVFWLPNAMIRHTASVVPPATRLIIGHQLLENLRRVAGKPCNTERGRTALERLYTRLQGDDGGAIAVLSGGVQQSQHLPGGIIILNRALVEDYEDPSVAAGFVLAEGLRTEQADPLLKMLHSTGLVSAFRLLTTGQMPAKALDAYGEELLISPMVPVDDERLLERFSAASISATPYAYAIDISGETTISLIEADPGIPSDAKPVLGSDDWTALQKICGE